MAPPMGELIAKRPTKKRKAEPSPDTESSGGWFSHLSPGSPSSGDAEDGIEMQNMNVGPSPSTTPLRQPDSTHLSIRGGLHVDGMVVAQGYLQYSDIRLKTQVEDIVDAVELISKLEGKRYRWRPNNGKVQTEEDDDMVDDLGIPEDDSEEELLTEGATEERKGRQVIGLIAQEVQKVLPEVVKEDEDGFLSVAYAEIVPVLIQAFNQHMQEYHAERDDFKTEFDSFKQGYLNEVDAGKEDLAMLARKMQTLVPHSPYSRLVKRLKKSRQNDRLRRRRNCCLFIIAAALLLAFNIALAILGPTTMHFSLCDNGDSGDGSTTLPLPSVPVNDSFRSYKMEISNSDEDLEITGTVEYTGSTSYYDELVYRMRRAVSPASALLQAVVLYGTEEQQNRRPGREAMSGSYRRDDIWGVSLDGDDYDEGVHFALLSLIEYEEINGLEGYQKGEEVAIFGNPGNQHPNAPIGSYNSLYGDDWSIYHNSNETLFKAVLDLNSEISIDAIASEVASVYDGEVIHPDAVAVRVSIDNFPWSRSTTRLALLATAVVTNGGTLPSFVYGQGYMEVQKSIPLSLHGVQSVNQYVTMALRLSSTVKNEDGGADDVEISILKQTSSVSGHTGYGLTLSFVGPRSDSYIYFLHNGML